MLYINTSIIKEQTTKYMLINLLKKFKSSNIWYNILKFFIKPIYDIVWLNFINFHGRILYFIWFMSDNKKVLFDNDKIFFSDQELDILSKKIFDDLSEEKINKIVHYLKNNNEVSENLTNSEEKKFKEDITSSIDVNLRKEVFKFCLSKKIISIVSSYLGVMPILNNVSLYINIPKDSKDIRGSMNWHRDDFGYKSLDLFVPISDINEDNGPFYCVREKETLGRFINYSNEINNPARGNRGKIEEKYFKFDSEDRDKVLKLSGEKGKALFIDSFNSYHKGGHCLKNFRLMLRITYSTVDTYLTNENYYDDVINDIKNYSKKDIFTNYILKKKSWFIKRFKLYKFLVLSYRFLSFKG